MPPSLLKLAALISLALFIGVYLWASWQEAYRLTRAAPLESRFQRGWWVPCALLLGLSVTVPFLQGANGLAAQREVRDIEVAARTALQEVREVVVGYRQTSLASELQRAHELLAAAGILCMVQNDAGALPTPIEGLLTWVVREGVTNVMRHSRAKQCVIFLAQQPGEICLTVTDDGQGDSRQGSTAALQVGQPGNGLRGLRERVETPGGRCEAGPADKHGFRLAAVLPLEGDRRQAALPAEQAGLQLVFC